MRLKYSNPIHVDDVAVDFPDLRIVLAHPLSWTEEGLAVAQHKPNVYFDMSGLVAEVLPRNLHQVRQLNPEKRQMLFGSDWPALTPDLLAGRLRRDAV